MFAAGLTRYRCEVDDLWDWKWDLGSGGGNTWDPLDSGEGGSKTLKLLGLKNNKVLTFSF